MKNETGSVQLAVRVIAKGGKFLGDDISGALVTVKHAQTGQVLASGYTKGGSGDLWNIMVNPHPRTTTVPAQGASVFTATIQAGNKPVPVLISATGPGAGLQSAATTSTTQWLMPGLTNKNGTPVVYACILELPGLLVQVMEPPTHLNITQPLPQTVHFAVNVAMMCGCPIDNSTDKDGPHSFPNPWPVSDFMAGCFIYCDDKLVEHIQLQFDDKQAPGRFTGQWQMKIPGFYTGQVYAYQISTGNTGTATVSFFRIPQQTQSASMNLKAKETIAGKEQLLPVLCTFLRSINIEVIEKKIPGDTFLPGVTIEHGKLVIDSEKLLYPGDVLHEAGHIAVSPPAERNRLNDNVLSNRPQAHGEEIVTLLWSYAAALHLRIDPKVVFHAHGYKGQSDWLLNTFAQKKYVGLPLLVWMGMALPHEHPNGYPHMQKWLRDKN